MLGARPRPRVPLRSVETVGTATADIIPAPALGTVACSAVTLMVSDLDIYSRSALGHQRHGDNALIEAAKMIDRMLANDGDEEGRLVWRGIKRAIEALQAVPSGLVHKAAPS